MLKEIFKNGGRVHNDRCSFLAAAPNEKIVTYNHNIAD